MARSARPTAAVLLVAAATFLPGCHHRPPRAVEEARSAVASAWAACAPEYAPRLFEAARAGLADVERRRDSRVWRGLRAGCDEVIRQAEEAERTARKLLAGARAAARTAIEDAEEALVKARIAGRTGASAGDVAAAEERLEAARRAASASHCNYVRARELAIEAKSLAKQADSETVASLRR